MPAGDANSSGNFIGFSNSVNMAEKIVQDNCITTKTKFDGTKVLGKIKYYRMLNVFKIPQSTLDRLIVYFGVKKARKLFQDYKDPFQAYVILLIANIFQCRKKQEEVKVFFPQDNSEEFQKILYFSSSYLVPAFSWLKNHSEKPGEFNGIIAVFYHSVLKHIFEIWKQQKININPVVKLNIMYIFGPSVKFE
ncbi:hypothetical protein PPACK8108_LOCUS3210 [Phakopsora pachyrhizi]|uniref:Uncharacterized protein n=1 Tax=Phakopsora pachyrhizi TaxID=170000 RepID=A0AAV0AJK2_PHAPC|nr:hypothetical protein PPACK8108_LOCUS3210 [Phakopsora pachyrhizi]